MTPQTPDIDERWERLRRRLGNERQEIAARIHERQEEIRDLDRVLAGLKIASTIMDEVECAFSLPESERPEPGSYEERHGTYKGAPF